MLLKVNGDKPVTGLISAHRLETRSLTIVVLVFGVEVETDLSRVQRKVHHCIGKLLISLLCQVKS